MTGPPAEFVELVGMARGYQWSRALAVAAELGMADALADGGASRRQRSTGENRLRGDCGHTDVERRARSSTRCAR